MKIIAHATNQSPPEDKIMLFRSFFRGRDDLYARRYENKKTNKNGYAPACGNEWIRGICEKPKIKCSECNHRRFLTINPAVIHAHLSGQDHFKKDFVLGLYPMLLDETCYFLAADFDQYTYSLKITPSSG